ncbi:MAG: cytochrome c-type biogenesis protein CcmH, partial [Betaproteobacteria bacterium]|nr:cytochrome c-type biogenesis protein CcmH [Betaproteobacteria bacterium]
AVAKLVRAGAEEEEIARFITARYGDFALYRPPLKPKTAALWIAPFALALSLLLLLPRFFRRRRAALDAAEERRAAKILADDKEKP